MRILPLLALGLITLFASACGSAQGRYAKFTARCNQSQALKDCHYKGVYAYKLGKKTEAKETLFRICGKGFAPSCKYATKWWPDENLSKLETDRLGTTEPLSPEESEAYVARNIHWKIDSEPRGAIINYRINSSDKAISSTGSMYLDRTPYEATRRFDVKGLTNKNLKFVRIVLEVEKKGYYPQRKEFQLSSVIQQGELSSFFSLEKKDDE